MKENKPTELQLKVPFADLYAQYLSIKSEVDEAISTVISESAYIRGRHVQDFEEGFRKQLGSKYCVSCANGTDALFIAMKMLGIGAGDEVITTAHSWIASSETISQTGAEVVFVDTDSETYTIDPALIEAAIGPRTKAIVAVHLYGHPADMDAIMEIASRRGLFVIEDCAQAHFAQYKGRNVGTMGHVAAFSFYPGKNLGAMGDAGCIVTDDEALSARCRRFANHGALSKHDHEIEGINSRLDGIQAAILNVKLRHIASWTAKRIEIAENYKRLLSGTSEIDLPVRKQWAKHVYHLYVIRIRNRDSVAKALSDSGISTAIQYPVALPFLKAYSGKGHRPEEFRNAFYNQSRILSLPMFPEMTGMQTEFVCSKLKGILELTHS